MLERWRQIVLAFRTSQQAGLQQIVLADRWTRPLQDKQQFSFRSPY